MAKSRSTNRSSISLKTALAKPSTAATKLFRPLPPKKTVVGFKIADYDHSAPLTIDPVLVYATFYGDTPLTDHSGDDIGQAIAIDSEGAAYVVGKTSSYEFQLVSNIEFITDPIDHTKYPTVTHSEPAPYAGFITKFCRTVRTSCIPRTLPDQSG